MGEVDKSSFDQKLLKVIDELKAPKSQYNSFGKYSYRSCEDIVEAAKPLLSKQGLRMKISDEVVQVGLHNYVKATVMVTDGEKSDFVTGFAREAEEQKGMADSQITGSTSSYARKYALNGMFDIDDTKDADTDEQHNDVETRPPVEKGANLAHPPTDKQVSAIKGYLVQLGVDTDKREEILSQVTTFQKASALVAELKEKMARKRQADNIEHSGDAAEIY